MTEKKQAYSRALSKRDMAVAIAIAVLGFAGVLSYFLFDGSVICWLARRGGGWEPGTLPLAFRQLGRTWVPVWFLLLWLYLSGRVRPVLNALLALVLLLPTVQPLKIGVGRPRPLQGNTASSQTPDSGIELRGRSFPSGDTASAFAVATALASFLEWPWLTALFAASTCVGFLRVAMLAHYPSDVCGGAGIGILCGWLALRVTRRWLSLESDRLGWWRNAALIGVVVIPICIWLFQGHDEFVIFLMTHGPIGVIVLAIAKLSRGFSGAER